MVAYDEEIGDAMTIESIAFQRSDWGEPTATASLEHFEIYMGHGASDQLGTAFEDNYLPGTRHLVYSSDPEAFSAGYDEWIEFDLDEPFWYNGEDNLLVELMWSWGEPGDHFLVWAWEAEQRSLFGYYGSPTGEHQEKYPYMQLNGTLVLQPATFGSIKADLGSIR